jgi:hypothetical protein
LSAVEWLVGLFEREGCVDVAALVRERGLDWVGVRESVLRALRAKGYRVRSEGGRLCAEKRGEDPAAKLAGLLLERGCVRKVEALELLGLDEGEWRRVVRRAAKALASKGISVYKEGYWSYCVEGASPRQAHAMSVTVPVRVDAKTNAALEELARRAGVSKAELIRRLIEEHLARTARPAAPPGTQ